MAVFEYRGLVVASGKQVHGVRDADNVKVLRAVLKREGILLTNAQEDAKRTAGNQRQRGQNDGKKFEGPHPVTVPDWTRPLT